jgi:hypothetical protein
MSAHEHSCAPLRVRVRVCVSGLPALCASLVLYIVPVVRVVCSWVPSLSVFVRYRSCPVSCRCRRYRSTPPSRRSAHRPRPSQWALPAPRRRRRRPRAGSRLSGRPRRYAHRVLILMVCLSRVRVRVQASRASSLPSSPRRPGHRSSSVESELASLVPARAREGIPRWCPALVCSCAAVWCLFARPMLAVSGILKCQLLVLVVSHS